MKAKDLIPGKIYKTSRYGEHGEFVGTRVVARKRGYYGAKTKRTVAVFHFCHRTHGGEFEINRAITTTVELAQVSGPVADSFDEWVTKRTEAQSAENRARMERRRMHDAMWDEADAIAALLRPEGSPPMYVGGYRGTDGGDGTMTPGQAPKFDSLSLDDLRKIRAALEATA